MCCEIRGHAGVAVHDALYTTGDGFCPTRPVEDIADRRGKSSPTIVRDWGQTLIID